MNILFRTFSAIGLAVLYITWQLAAASVVESGITSGSLVLCNTLGSDDEVQNSPIGAGFGIHSDASGGVSYPPGKFGHAMATSGGETGGGGYLTMSPDLFFPPDKTKGTVEMWIQKRIQRFIPYVTPLVNIFGDQSYSGSPPNRGYQSLNTLWADGLTGGDGVVFFVADSLDVWHSCAFGGWDDVEVGQWVHLAFGWDLEGIDGSSERMRIYLDGDLVASNTDGIPGLKEDTREVRILAHHAFSRFGQPTAYLDNIKVWDFAKTDFSDRFEESCELAAPEPDIEVDPVSYDFGEVELGNPSTMFLNIANVGSSVLTVANIDLEFTTDGDPFAIAPLSLPMVVDPATFSDVEVTYDPKLLYTQRYNTIVITSDDPDEGLIEVPITGTGVASGDPSEAVADIQLHIATAEINGTIFGAGSGNSAEKKLNALKNMIESAGQLMDIGMYVEGCMQLSSIYKKVDGMPKPPDFVGGEAVAGVEQGIAVIMNDLMCDQLLGQN